MLDRPHWRARKVHLTLAGTGITERALQKIVANFNLPNVQFAGFVENIEQFWGGHHALLLASRFEGMPLALVEAMLCGRACIATDVGGNPELIRDGVNGFLAKAAAVDLLDEAMNRAWENRHRLREMGEAAANDVRQWVSPDPTGDFVRELEALAASPRRQPAAPAHKGLYDCIRRHNQARDGILFVSNDATRTGAPIALLHFLRWYKKNGQRPFSILFGEGGELTPDFAQLAETWATDRSHWCPGGDTHAAFVEGRARLVCPPGARSRRAPLHAPIFPALIYVNSIVSAHAVEMLAPQAPILTHVHELNSGFQLVAPPVRSGFLTQTRQFIACSNAVREYLIREPWRETGSGRDRLRINSGRARSARNGRASKYSRSCAYPPTLFSSSLAEP